MKAARLAAAAFLAALPAFCAMSAEDEEGFVPMFNGRDLTGWEGATDTYKA